MHRLLAMMVAILNTSDLAEDRIAVSHAIADLVASSEQVVRNHRLQFLQKGIEDYLAIATP